MSSSLKALVFFVLILNLPCCYGSQASAVVFESFNVILIIWDAVSDILVLAEMYSKQAHYNTFIDEISDSSAGYSLSFCYPTLFPAEWFEESELSSFGCFCEEFDFHCVNNSITLGTSNNDGSINYTIDVLNSSYHLVSDAVSSETTCSSDIWGISDSFRQYFSINDWQCQYCNCSNSNYTVYDKDYSVAIKKLEYEYMMISSQTNTTHCNPQKMLKLNENSWKLDDLLVPAWIFLIIGIISACIGVGIRSFCIQMYWDELEPHKQKHISQRSPSMSNAEPPPAPEENAPGFAEKMKEYTQNMAAYTQKEKSKRAVLQKSNDELIEGAQSLHWEIKWRYEASQDIMLAKAIAQMVVTLLRDAPNTIIALVFLVFLYNDNGYYCLKAFVNDSDDVDTGFPLTEAVIDKSDSVLVALARNWQILFSFLASIVTILFNAFFNAYTYSIEMDHKDRHDGYKNGGSKMAVFKTVMVYGLAFVATIMLWTPTMGVLYFYVAPAFDKTWTPALVMFSIGCSVWGISLIMIIYFVGRFCYDECK